MNDDILYDFDSALRLDKGIPCGNGYISPKYECRVKGVSVPRSAIAPPPPKNKKRQSSLKKLRNYRKVVVPLSLGTGALGLAGAGAIVYGMNNQKYTGSSEPPSSLFLRGETSIDRGENGEPGYMEEARRGLYDMFPDVMNPPASRPPTPESPERSDPPSSSPPKSKPPSPEKLARAAAQKREREEFFREIKEAEPRMVSKFNQTYEAILARQDIVAEEKDFVKKERTTATNAIEEEKKNFVASNAEIRSEYERKRSKVGSGLSDGRTRDQEQDELDDAFLNYRSKAIPREESIKELRRIERYIDKIDFSEDALTQEEFDEYIKEDIKPIGDVIKRFEDGEADFSEVRSAYSDKIGQYEGGLRERIEDYEEEREYYESGMSEEDRKKDRKALQSMRFMNPEMPEGTLHHYGKSDWSDHYGTDEFYSPNTSVEGRENEILGVPPEATVQDLELSYKSQMLDLSPKAEGRKEQKLARIRDLNAAYKSALQKMGVIKNDSTNYRYDSFYIWI